MPTQKQIADARKVLSEVENGVFWPKGSNLISKMGYISFNICNENLFCVSKWRELTSSELQLLREIPEFAKDMK